MAEVDTTKHYALKLKVQRDEGLFLTNGQTNLDIFLQESLNLF